MLIIAAAMSIDDPFQPPLCPGLDVADRGGRQDAIDLARQKLAGETGSDHVALLNAYRGWEEARHRGRGGDWPLPLLRPLLLPLPPLLRPLLLLLLGLGGYTPLLRPLLQLPRLGGYVHATATATAAAAPHLSSPP